MVKITFSMRYLGSSLFCHHAPHRPYTRVTHDLQKESLCIESPRGYGNTLHDVRRGSSFRLLLLEGGCLSKDIDVKLLTHTIGSSCESEYCIQVIHY